MDEMKQLTLVGNETPEQAEAIGLHYEIVSAAQAAASSLLDLGRKLKRMRDSGKYKALGFETFGDYTEQAVHIRQRQAYTYISVVEKLPAQLIEENAAAGVTKLALLAKLGPQDREEVAGDLANITVTELQKLIDEKNDMAEQLSLLSAPPAAEAEAHEVDVEAELKKAADQARAEAEAKAAADLEALREQHRKALEESEAKQEERLQAARREAEKAAAEKIRQAKRDAEADAVRREAEAADKARKAAERTQKERGAELEKAQQAAAEAQEQAEALQKKLRIQQSPAGAKFALLFEDVQQKAAAIMDLADEMRDGGQQELADKFTSALAAALRALADQAEGGEA